jgi:hypothetical protein
MGRLYGSNNQYNAPTGGGRLSSFTNLFDVSDEDKKRLEQDKKQEKLRKIFEENNKKIIQYQNEANSYNRKALPLDLITGAGKGIATDVAKSATALSDVGLKIMSPVSAAAKTITGGGNYKENVVKDVAKKTQYEDFFNKDLLNPKDAKEFILKAVEAPAWVYGGTGAAKAGKIVKGAVAGAKAGIPFGVTQTIENTTLEDLKKDPANVAKDLAKNLAVNSGGGAVLGGGVGAISSIAGKILDKIKVEKDPAIKRALLTEWIKSQSTKKTTELIPSGTLQKDAENQMMDIAGDSFFNGKSKKSKTYSKPNVTEIGINSENIISVQRFGSSVEGKTKPNDFDHFVTVKNGSMKFKTKGGLTEPIIKKVGNNQYVIMPEKDSQELLDAMLYTGRKDQDRLYSGKTIDITKDFLAKKNSGSTHQSIIPEAKPGTIQSFRQPTDLESATITGSIRSGEPSKISTDLNTGKFNSEPAKNIIESLQKTDAYTSLANMRRRGVITNEAAIKQAEDMGVGLDDILSIKKGTVLNKEQNIAVRQVISAYGDSLAQLQEKALSGDIEAIKLLPDAVANQTKLLAIQRGISAETGRALQSMNVAVDSVTQAQKSLNKLLEKADKTPGALEYITKQLGDIDLNDVDQVIRLMSKLSNKGVWDKIVEYATAAKLWSPTTHIVNNTSNTVRLAMEYPTRITSAGIDLARSTITGKPRERFFRDANEFAVGAIGGVQDARKGVVKAFLDDLYDITGKVSEVDAFGPAIKGRVGKSTVYDKVMDKVGYVVRTPFRALGAEDVLYKSLGQSAEIRTQAFRMAKKEGLDGDALSKRMTEIINNPPLDLVEKAQEFGREITFQKDLGKFGSKINQVRNAHPVVKLFFPFFRTPVNLAKQAIEWSPFGVKQLVDGIKKGGGESSDAMAKYLIGSTTTAALTMYALDGRISGSGPSNTAEKDALYREGWQPYSIKIGDKWIAYNRIDPFSQWFQSAGAIADAFQEYQKGDKETKDMYKMVGSAIWSNAKSILDKTYVKGLNDVVNAIEDPKRYGENFFNNLVTGSIVPSVIGAAAGATDKKLRKTDGLSDAFKMKIPGLRQTLPENKDIYGEGKTDDRASTSKVLLPFKTSKVKNNELDKELRNIDMIVGAPGKTQRGKKLNEREYAKFSELAGKKFANELSRVIKPSNHHGLSKSDKSRVVERIISNSRNEAQDELFGDKEKSKTKKLDYKSLGL